MDEFFSKQCRTGSDCTKRALKLQFDHGLTLAYMLYFTERKFFTFTTQSRLLTTLKTQSYENTEGKGENAGNQHFLLVPLCFLVILETFNLSSADAFNLVTSKILSLGKEFNRYLGIFRTCSVVLAHHCPIDLYVFSKNSSEIAKFGFLLLGLKLHFICLTGYAGLTHYHTMPYFNALKIYNCGKHCEKRRNCL